MPSTLDEIKIAAEAYDRMKKKVMSSLGWNEGKADAWFLTANPHLGNIRPLKLITMNRSDYLERWIDSALALRNPGRRLTLIEGVEKPIVKEHGQTEDRD